jgi:hypothetical protein
MRCPQCGVDQPGGVSVCGYCGALMSGGAPALRSELAEAATRGVAQASAATRGARRWLGLVAAALAIGLVAGWAAFQLASAARVPEDGGAAARPAAPEPTAAPEPAPASAPAGSDPVGVAEPDVVRGRGVDRVTEDELLRLAEQLAGWAEQGDARELARRVDGRARYLLRIEDDDEIRELRGGKPELLAHWLAPWMVGEIFGGGALATIEIERVAVDFDRRRGLVVRRVEALGDVSRLRFPRALLEPLALQGELDLEQAERVDLSALRVAPAACTGTESLRFAVGPAGVKVVEVERAGRCRPAG